MAALQAVHALGRVAFLFRLACLLGVVCESRLMGAYQKYFTANWLLALRSQVAEPLLTGHRQVLREGLGNRNFPFACWAVGNGNGRG